MLNNDLTIANVYVQDGSVNAVRPIPSHVNQFVVVIRFVKNNLRLDVTDGWLVLCVLLD